VHSNGFIVVLATDIEPFAYHFSIQLDSTNLGDYRFQMAQKILPLLLAPFTLIALPTPNLLCYLNWIALAIKK